MFYFTSLLKKNITRNCAVQQIVYMLQNANILIILNQVDIAFFYYYSNENLGINCDCV